MSIRVSLYLKKQEIKNSLHILREHDIEVQFNIEDTFTQFNLITRRDAFAETISKSGEFQSEGTLYPVKLKSMCLNFCAGFSDLQNHSRTFDI